MSIIINGIQVEEYDGYDMSGIDKTYTPEEQAAFRKKADELFAKALIANGIDPSRSVSIPNEKVGRYGADT